MSGQTKYKPAVVIEESPFKDKLSKLDGLKEKYNTAVKYNNKLIAFYKRIECNQLDRAIIDFQKSIGAYGMTDGELKTLLREGVESTIRSSEKRVEELAQQIEKILL